MSNATYIERYGRGTAAKTLSLNTTSYQGYTPLQQTWGGNVGLVASGMVPQVVRNMRTQVVPVDASLGYNALTHGVQPTGACHFKIKSAYPMALNNCTKFVPRKCDGVLHPVRENYEGSGPGQQCFDSTVQSCGYIESDSWIGGSQGSINCLPSGKSCQSYCQQSPFDLGQCGAGSDHQKTCSPSAGGTWAPDALFPGSPGCCYNKPNTCPD